MIGAGEWRGGRLDPARLATGVLAYDIVADGLDPAAFDRIADGLAGRFDVTRRAPTSLVFERGEGFERPRADPFRSVDRGGADLPETGRLALALSIRSQLAFLTFGFVAVWLIGFHESNPLWWGLAWGVLVWWSAESVRRRVGRRLREWVEGEAATLS